MGGKSGFGGQKFDPAVLETIRKVRAAFPDLPISVDIGATPQTAPQMVAAGATILCAGSAIFESEDIGGAIDDLKEAAGRG
jgi:ribulose-phosphate 3-epimerase